jgi:hypothetical protein
LPPIQPSLRGSLLTGASALALSVTGSPAHAQGTRAASQNMPVVPSWTFWIEGGGFATGGGNINIPSLPGLGAPFISFALPRGVEGAVGFDYHWQNQPWHFVFDFRYGRSKTVTGATGSSSSSSSKTFLTHGVVPYGTTILTTTINKAFSNSSSTLGSEWESHAVLDFMIGRDVGIGGTKGEFEFGVRVADLQANAQAQGNTNSLTIITGQRTFYVPSSFGVAAHVGHSILSGSSSSSSSFSANWNSRFFGVGPRAAITDSVPIVGFWSFDYEGGIAALFGNRSFNAGMFGPAGVAGFNTGPLVGIFNADAWVALSYAFTPQFKVSGGLRGDYYAGALTTYSVNGSGLQTIDRSYWGYFLRLTGAL